MFKKSKKEATVAAQDPDLMTPQTPEEYANRGWIFYARQNYNKAQSDFEEAIRLDPDLLDAIYALGLTYKGCGQSMKAVECFKKAAEASEYLDNHERGRMVRRLAHGHIHEIETGDWNLEKETWQKKS